jgi:redox-sensitive bicupin YhaK (pirin superfamily)
MTDDIILGVVSLGPGTAPWQTADPFMFCVHHSDHFPKANDQMGPDASLAGRTIGNDFSGKDGWSMYHGQDVPGFPRHPHSGFETITLARNGFIDHSDSLGATARFGQGDVQWMTAGSGVVHSEAFPLLDRDGPNHTELFQIWLNLPREDKSKDAYFTMFWHEDVPNKTFADDAGRDTELVVVAGAFDELEPPSPPPSSWASRDDADIAVWTMKMEPGAEWTLPAAASEDVNRVLYFFAGDTCEIAGKAVEKGHGVQLRPDVDCPIKNGGSEGEFLVLQGRPIGEPVVQHGPFVANTQGEIRQAMLDYQRTGFGGWPWDADAPVHPRDKGRFAIHADGREETPDEQ